VTSPHSRRPFTVYLTLVMVAVNLRIGLTSIPTLEVEIQAATGWSNAAIGTITTIPVICMGLFALAVPRIAGMIGRRRTVALALAILVVALGSRVFAGQPIVLTTSALLVGTAIALAMGLVPSIVRGQLPTRMGRATGIWTGAMMISAAAGAALTVPLAELFGSWQAALAFWALPALVGLVVWAVVEGTRDAPTGTTPPVTQLRDMPWRSRPAWAITGFLTLNSIVFYTLVAWLAPSFVDRGWSQADAGFLFGAFTVSQVVAALTMPALVERVHARRTIYTVSVIVVGVGLMSIGFLEGDAVIAAVVIMGFALGAGFAMGLTLLSEFAHDMHSSARLTAMALFVTYLAASIGPFVAGALLDAGTSWSTLYVLLGLVALLQTLTVSPLRRGVSIT